jgi:polar amino acid transport system substrate-binding protein
MRRAASVLTLLVGLVAAPALAAAPVKLVTGNGYAPFTDSKLPKGGMATALVRAVYAEMGRDVSVAFRPWKRGYQQTLRGEYAATFPYVASEDRKKAYLYSDPIFTVRNKPIAAADSDVTASAVDQLKGMTYCLPQGYAPASSIKKMTEGGDLTRLKPNSLEQCMRMVTAGRADFTLANTIVARSTATSVFGDMERVRFLDLTVSRSRLHVIVPKTRDDAKQAVERFNAALKTVRENGTYDEVVDSFVGDI